jgi:hypothetical protein
VAAFFSVVAAIPEVAAACSELPLSFSAPVSGFLGAVCVF